MDLARQWEFSYQRYIHVFDIEKHKKGYAEQTEEAEMAQKVGQMGMIVVVGHLM